MSATSDQLFYPVPGFDPSALEGKVVVVPSVSLANLPQLAVDILIASLNLHQVGLVGDGTTVAPFVGRGDDGRLATGGLALYGREENDIFFLQQRSPVLKSRKDDHVQLLSDFVKASKFDCTLILTSLDAANQDDAQLQTPYQSLLPPHTTALTSHPLLGRLRRLPPFSVFLEMVIGLTSTPTPPALGSPSKAEAALYPPFLPSAGLTRRLLHKLHGEGLAHGAVAAWCVEGDNRGDAMGLAGVVLGVLDLNNVELKEPSSWKGLFGAVEGWSGGQGADSELYG